MTKEESKHSSLISLVLLATLFLMQPVMLLAVRMHCWLLVNFLSTSHHC